jgi:hypothetical protein
MRKTIQIALLVCAFQFCFSWEKQYSTGDIWRIVESVDSNLYFIAWDTTYYYSLYKISSIGDSSWCLSFYYTEYNFAGLFPMEDSSIFFTGSFSNNGYLVRYSALGEFLWSNSYPSPFPVNNSIITDMDRTPEGDYIAVGAVGNLGGSRYKPWIVKINDSGDTLWNKMLDIDYSFFKKVIVREDGKFGTIGYEDYNSFFAFFNEIGDSLQYYNFISFFPISDLRLYNFSLCADGGFCCVGMVHPGSFYEQEIFLSRINTDGSLKWQRSISIPLKSEGVGIFEQADKGFIVFGHNNFISGDFIKPIMIRLDSLGDTLWTRVYPDDTFYVGSAIKCINGDYVLAGAKRTGELDYKNVLRLDSLGNSVPIDKIDEKSVQQRIELSISPNPFNSSCKITVGFGRGLINQTPTLEIFDLSGRCICSLRQAQGTVSGDRSVSLSNRWSPARAIPSGVYLVRATTPDGQSAMKKVVLVR